MLPLLEERLKRQFLANEAIRYGYGGVSLVSRISGVSSPTIIAGIKQIKGTGEAIVTVRRSGGGRKHTQEKHPKIEEYIREIVDGKTFGDPMRVLSYTSESMRKIVMQGGEPHPDRNAQFEHINKTVGEYLDTGDPVISVDTKKENIGNFKQNGAEYRQKHDPRRALDHDFPIEELGKISPYFGLKVFHVGGKLWPSIHFLTVRKFTLIVTAAVAMVIGYECGNISFKNLRIKQG